jgi:hypothetical protein
MEKFILLWIGLREGYKSTKCFEFHLLVVGVLDSTYWKSFSSLVRNALAGFSDCSLEVAQFCCGFSRLGT